MRCRGEDICGNPDRLPSVSDILSVTAHRPWPLPHRPWVMYQRWHDLLFAHWAMPPEKVRTLVPPELELDLFQGNAWVGVIPFWMSHVHFRGLPPVPTASRFPELNVRTYVRGPKSRRANEPVKPGVYFFSLDAASVLAVLGARAGAGLPYFWAEMQAKVSDDEVRYRSTRRQSPRPAELAVSYGPTGPVAPQKASIETFLTERYCLYVVRSGRVHRLEIHHLPWPLQPAQADFETNTMAQRAGIELPPAQPLLQFAKLLEVFVFAPEEVRNPNPPERSPQV